MWQKRFIVVPEQLWAVNVLELGPDVQTRESNSRIIRGVWTRSWWSMKAGFWTGPEGVHGGSCTFDVLRQDLPRAGVLDTVSTPGGVELEQPGRRRVGDGALQAAATQDHQRVFLRVQAAGGAHVTVTQPQDGRCFQPEPQHPWQTAGDRRWTHAETPNSFTAERCGGAAASI